MVEIPNQRVILDVYIWMNHGAKAIKGIFLDASVLLSLGAVALVWGTCLQLKLDCQPWPLLTLIFTGTFLGYNFHRTANIISHGFKYFIRELWLFAGMGLCIAFLISASLKIQRFTLWMLLPIAFATLLYTLPTRKVPHWLLIRRFPFVKMFFVSGVWTLVTVLIPVLESNLEPGKDPMLFGLFARFTFFVALTLPFDVRDRQSDALDGLKTLPVLLGEQASYFLSSGFTLIFIVMHVIGGWIGLEPLANMIPALITGTILLLLLHCHRCRQHPHYFSFWLDGLILLFGVLLIIMHLVI